MLSRETYLELLGHVDDLIAEFEAMPDENVRERFVAVLTGLDLVHREGLTRLVARMRESGGAPLIDIATGDPVVKTLLALYDLSPLDVPQQSAGAGFVPLERLMARGSNGNE